MQLPEDLLEAGIMVGVCGNRMVDLNPDSARCAIVGQSGCDPSAILAFLGIVEPNDGRRQQRGKDRCNYNWNEESIVDHPVDLLSDVLLRKSDVRNPHCHSEAQDDARYHHQEDHNGDRQAR